MFWHETDEDDGNEGDTQCHEEQGFTAFAEPQSNTDGNDGGDEGCGGGQDAHGADSQTAIEQTDSQRSRQTGSPSNDPRIKAGMCRNKERRCKEADESHHRNASSGQQGRGPASGKSTKEVGGTVGEGPGEAKKHSQHEKPSLLVVTV